MLTTNRRTSGLMLIILSSKRTWTPNFNTKFEWLPVSQSPFLYLEVNTGNNEQRYKERGGGGLCLHIKLKHHSFKRDLLEHLH